MLIIHLGANHLACSWVGGILRHVVIPDQTGHSCCTRGTRAAGTECQDADEVLLLNECLVTNDPGLCYRVPWAVLP